MFNISTLVRAMLLCVLVAGCAYPEDEMTIAHLGSLRSPCDWSQAENVVEADGLITCTMMDGETLIEVRDGVNLWRNRRAQATYKPDEKYCLIELEIRRKPGDWLHEIEHCRGWRHRDMANARRGKPKEEKRTPVNPSYLMSLE